MLTREHLVWVVKELVLSAIASCARHTTVVSESGHPRAYAAQASLLEHQGNHPRHNQGASNLYATLLFQSPILVSIPNPQDRVPLRLLGPEP